MFLPYETSSKFNPGSLFIPLKLPSWAVLLSKGTRYFWGRRLQHWRIHIGQVLTVFFFSFFLFWWATFLPFTSQWLLCIDVDAEMWGYDIYNDMIWYFNGMEIWHIHYKDLTHLADVPDIPQMHDSYKWVTIWKGNGLETDSLSNDTRLNATIQYNRGIINQTQRSKLFLMSWTFYLNCLYVAARAPTHCWPDLQNILRIHATMETRTTMDSRNNLVPIVENAYLPALNFPGTCSGKAPHVWHDLQSSLDLV